MIRIVFGLVFLTGATGLIYQVTWQKYLSTLLGSHASAAAVILSLFFLFLSLGYSLFGKYATRILRNQLNLYAAIEFVIGLYALYSPSLFEWIFNTYIGSLHGQGSGEIVTALLLCAFFIAIPTTLMGGTIPVLTQALSANYEVSSKTHAYIYGVNTLGAVLGCLGAGFFLIENFGLDGTLLIAGNLNVIIALLAFLIARMSNRNFAGPELSSTTSGDKVSIKEMAALLVVSFSSGYYTFSLEKIIIKMAGLSLGSTTYTYSIIVAAFILAIGIGSLIVTVHKKFEEPRYFGAIQLGALISVMLLYFTIPSWPDILMRTRAIFQSSIMNFEYFWIAVFFVCATILLIPVGLIGTNLPLIFGVLRSRNKELTHTVGKLYALNCLGAALGAVIGGYAVYFYLNGEQAFRLVVYVVAVATLITTTLFFDKVTKKIFISIVFISVIGFSLMPKWQDSSFVPGLFNIQNFSALATSTNEAKTLLRSLAGPILYSRFDPNTVATVIEQKDKEKNLALYVNGKPDAYTSGDHTARAMAALTPMAVAANDVKNIFMVGLGAGLSAAILTQFKEVEKVHIAEISEGVVESLPYFERFNYGLKSRLGKVKLEVGDAYRVLMGQGLYDLIICEPSNPWVTGIDKLFSKEFYELGAKHLSENGIYIQWFPLSGVDNEIFLTILNTFRSVFPHVAIFSAHGGAFTLVGSKSPIMPDINKTVSRYKELESVYKKFKMNSPFSVFANEVSTEFIVNAALYKVDKVNSLFSPQLEFKSGRAFFANLGINYSNLVVNSVPIPTPFGTKEDQLTFEKLSIKVEPQAIRDALDLITDNVSIHRIRLLAYVLKNYPEHELFKNEILAFDDYSYFLGRKSTLKRKPAEVADTYPRLESLTQKYRNLVALGERPKLSLLAELIEGCKVSIDNEVEAGCIKEKAIAISILGKPEDSDKIRRLNIERLDSGEISFIQTTWNAIKETYKKLDSF